MDAAPDPETRASGLRQELRERHRAVGPLTAADVDRPAVDTLLGLTARMLDAEEELRARQDRTSRGTTDRIVAGCVAVLVVAAVVVATTGLIGGWVGAWGVALLVLVVVIAGVLAAADLLGERPDSSTTRRIDAAAALAGGLAVLAAATGVLPWWGVLVAVVLGAAAIARIVGVLPGRS